ncbi:hypothetical protein ARMSODRAFT_978192 [Armillaria solidipes]|uniref:Uncharacterized protein n=1 Tax=Armillaria solidipes TaxID=1076256 RepID=A0A2H3B4H9_9AGAR|nr:hypothetical protein ARMSODRAFT_978192 [Armillaria solidipes]
MLDLQLKLETQFHSETTYQELVNSIEGDGRCSEEGRIESTYRCSITSINKTLCMPIQLLPPMSKASRRAKSGLCEDEKMTDEDGKKGERPKFYWRRPYRDKNGISGLIIKDLQSEAILVHVIVSIIELVWHRHSNVFEVKNFKFTIQFAIGDHPGPWEVIRDFIDSLLKITFFFYHLF